MDSVESQGIVMDLGVSQGNDTAFYVAKGFKVIAVEADPGACELLQRRFAHQLASGDVRLLNFAASDTFGKTTDFYVHDVHPGVSAVSMRPELPTGYSTRSVTTIDWNTLRAQAGVPRYIKIDIEGQEEAFLNGMMVGGPLPEFISVECHTFRPIDQLHALGYRRFKLVDQNPAGGFRLPQRQMEGLEISWSDFEYTSGPFGLDVFGDGVWSRFDAVRDEWHSRQPEMSRTWFDCHAWRPN